MGETSLSPRCWRVVKKHAQRLVCAPPSFIVCSHTPRSAQPPRGSSCCLSGGGCGGPGRGTLRLAFPGRGVQRTRGASLSGRKFCPESPHSQLGLGTFLGACGVFTIKGMWSRPLTKPSAVNSFGKLDFKKEKKKIPVSHQSFPTMDLGQDEELGRRASQFQWRSVRTRPSVTSRLGCKCRRARLSLFPPSVLEALQLKLAVWLKKKKKLQNT